MPRATRPRIAQSKSEEAPAPTGVPEETIQEDIARLAYALWEQRGPNDGTAEEDWLRAEQEVRARSKR